MPAKVGSVYGQFCPLAMAAELLCNRWTMLIVRELLEGSTSFNDLSRGVPLMSRNLLARRLKELEAAGAVACHAGPRGAKGSYRLTPAGEALGAVVKAMANWGQEWIDVEPSVRDVDARLLMWDIRRNVKPLPEFPPRFTVHFLFPDAETIVREHWLVFDGGEVDLCYFDPGHEVHVEIEAGLRTMAIIWMGWEDLTKAQLEGRLSIRGDRKLVQRAREWLGLSKLAGIPKQAEGLRVFRESATVT
ncbi:MAG: helix-turn-helix transcriptional regulator [Betaproteobacteria bacterium]|nr:helix-turn-helix transcriptional regulator [Betaproteobacteria bacterium]